MGGFSELVPALQRFDCLVASCRVCWILCLLVPVGLLSSQDWFLILKADVLSGPRMMNSTFVEKYSANMNAAESSRRFGLGERFLGMVTLCDLLILTP